MNKRTLLDVDPTIVERNLMITDPNEKDELKSLFPTAQEEIPSKLVKPSPGFCVKTHSVSNEKIFINVCQTDAIPAPDDISDGQLMEILQSDTPSEFRVPMSIGDARLEFDKSGNNATAYDIAIHPNFFKKVESNKLFKHFFLTVVFEGLGDKYGIIINTNDFTILKNRKVMGTLQLHRIQQREINRKMNKEKKLIEEIDSPMTPLITEIKKPPPYRLNRISTDDNKQYYVGDIYLPDVVSVNDISLDVGEDRIVLESKKTGCVLDIFMPQLIQHEKVTAKLNKMCGILTITMPIVRSL